MMMMMIMMNSHYCYDYYCSHGVLCFRIYSDDVQQVITPPLVESFRTDDDGIFHLHVPKRCDSQCTNSRYSLYSRPMRIEPGSLL